MTTMLYLPRSMGLTQPLENRWRDARQFQFLPSGAKAQISPHVFTGGSLLSHRIGTVTLRATSCEPTTRTTDRSLNSLRCARPLRSQPGVSVIAGPGGVWNTAETSRNGRWSSRPRPVTRLQATSQPLKGDARREQRRIAWLRRNRTVPTSLAFAGEGKRSLSPKEQFGRNSSEGTDT